jgi:hypothetical protein
MKKLLSEAYRIAVEKVDRHPMKGISFLHYSFIVADNQIIEWGTNSHHEPEKHWGYDARNKAWDKSFQGTTHSELAAFKSARGLLKGNPFSMINIRLGARNNLKISAPCDVCMGWLPVVGCQKIWFSVNGGWAKLV